MSSPDSSSAATPPAPAPSVPTAAAGRSPRQVVLDPEKLRALRSGHISLDILAAGRHRLSPAAIRRAFRGEPVLVSIAWHLSRALGVELSEIVVREVEDT